MPDGADPFFSLERGRFTYFPVVPGRAEFAAEVRRAILEQRPQIVAVELPGSLQAAYLRAVDRLPEITVLLYPDDQDPDHAVYVPVEPADPFTEAVRTARELGYPVLFLEPDVAERPHLPERYPDTYALNRIGRERYIERYRLHPAARTDEVAEHAAGMALKLQGADPMARVLVVCALNLLDPLLDAMEIPQEQPPKRLRPREVRLLNPHPDCLAEITVEYPYFQERYEGFRVDMLNPDWIDRARVQIGLLREAEREYESNTGEKLAHWQRRMMARYTRNLAWLNTELTAAIFDITVAARSIVDDNYGWEVWAMANRYTPQQDTSTLETVNLSGDEVWLDTRRIRLRRRLPRPKQRVRPASLKPHKREKKPGDWARAVDGNAICSYPPEDLVIEDYGRFLKQKARSVLSAERERTEPFTTSILDGIDLRTTIRHWHEKKIYVRRVEKMAGEVGAVVVIFDEDRAGRYRYLTTWLGENQNESDMAFYSTYPFEHMVGPGIGRAEYGGFLMALPPRRMFDVWRDPDYSFAETKPERLLMAAIDYSVQRYVVYVAERPPRSIFRSIAAHLNRRIVYIPIGQLSPSKLKKIRVVHVLDSYERRENAKEYLW